MKKVIVFISAIILVLAACVSNQGAAEKTAGGGGGKSSASGGARTSSGGIPIVTKSMVLFADGTLDEYTTSDYDSSYTNVLNQSRYSASGALLEKVEYSYEEGKGWLSTKITRDVEDKLKNRVVYQYNDQGHLWKETLVNKSGKAVSAYEYGYDGKGNRISRTVNSGTGIKMAETTYAYNNNGALASSETKDGSGKKISSTVNKYDNQGNLVSQQVLTGDGQVSTVINAVWQNGLELKNEQAGADGALQLRVTNDYGAEGELLKRTVENLQGESTRILQYEYTFKPGRKQG
jgi:hypothetical protein